MRVQRELKRSKGSPKVALLSGSAAPSKQRLNADPHHFIWDEDKVFEPDWEVSAADLDKYVDILSRE
jgi:hypothetical protein